MAEAQNTSKLPNSSKITEQSSSKVSDPSSSKNTEPSSSKGLEPSSSKISEPSSSKITEPSSSKSLEPSSSKNAEPSSSKISEPSSSKGPEPSSSKSPERSSTKNTEAQSRVTTGRKPTFLDIDSSFDSDTDEEENPAPDSLYWALFQDGERRPDELPIIINPDDYRVTDADLRFLHQDDEFDEFDGLDDDFNSHHVEVPLFLQNAEEEDMLCEICYEVTTVRRRLCCNMPVCDMCVDAYVEDKVRDGVVKIGCLAACDSFIYRDEILGRLPVELKDKYYKFLIDANKDPYIKTCPRCSHVKQVSKAELDDKLVIKKGLQVVCDKCELKWCFPCHSPWHAELTCKEFRKGDRLLQVWAHEMHFGQVNAQKCPRCKVFIQRTSGCDHMTCSSCKTSFCYRCGKRYRSLKMFGNHFSRYSLFGCKYNLLPKRPGARRFVRGAVFGGKLLGSAVLASLALAAGAVFIGTSFVVVPAIVGYKLMKRRKIRRRTKQRLQQSFAHTNAELMLRIEHALTFENRNLHGEQRNIFDEDTLTREERNWVMLSRLEDEQQVEVLVHRTLGASSSETSEAPKEAAVEETPKDKPVVTVTNITEELSEEGYTRVIAHVFAKNAEETSPKNSVTLSELADQASKDITKDSNSMDFKSEQTRKLSKGSDVDSELSDVDFELAPDSNGCFVNIFSKKLNAWQVHNTLPNANISAKTLLKIKSGTWEKSGKKLSNSSSFDIKTFSSILTSQSEKDIKSCDSSDIPECSSAPEEEILSPCDFVTRL